MNPCNVHLLHGMSTVLGKCKMKKKNKMQQPPTNQQQKRNNRKKERKKNSTGENVCVHLQGMCYNGCCSDAAWPRLIEFFF